MSETGTLEEALGAIRQALEEAQTDMAKCASGNQAAGTRVRKVLRAAKNDLHALVKATLAAEKGE